MRLRYYLTALLLVGLCAPAQQPQTPIDTYIHQGWDTLSRSMNDCASFPDSKLAAAPVLYLPAEEKLPAAVRTLQQQCNVQVLHLPHRIRKPGDLQPNQIPTPGLLYLPNRYVVPGGRFNEMYGWDSYFILLGELADGRIDLARGTIENFFYEIDHYGSILNANRTYYLTRSQPPFLSSMVLAVYHAEEPENPKEARNFLRKALPYLIRDHSLWVTLPHLDPTTGLSRYVDLGNGPVPEINDDSTYYIDVIHWLLAHPAQAPAGYLEKATTAPAHCAQSGSSACLQTQADGYELTPSFYAGDRAMRESGFDTSFRFGPFGGSTEDYAPICLNALLYKYERDLAFITATLGDTTAAVTWSSSAGDRLQAINSLLWDENTGLYFDYDLQTQQRSTYPYLTTYYALWAGIASPAQAKRLVAALPLFERPGGLAMSTQITGEQWDAPFGWAPTNWLATIGLARYGYTAEAHRIAREFTSTVAINYAHDSTIREKYNVADASANVAVATGYKANGIGFGWTNAVYVRMMQFLNAPQPSSPALATPSQNQ
jgi:alpha,alpha-trehalase